MSERERSGGLDDLFAFGDEPAPEPAPEADERDRPPSRAAWVLRNLLLVTVATVVTVALLRSNGIQVSILLIVAAFVALRLLMLAVSEVAPPTFPKAQRARNSADNDGLYRWAGGDSLRTAVRGWERSLGWSQSEPERFSRSVLPVLAELMDERLRLRHGVTRASDPRRARELLGDPVWQMLEEPGRRAPKARDLTLYVETLERL